MRKIRPAPKIYQGVMTNLRDILLDQIEKNKKRDKIGKRKKRLVAKRGGQTMIPTKEEILRAIDTIAEYAPISGYSCPGKRIKNALRILVERADDVDRLVEAAKEATTIIHAKTADDQTEYKIAGAEIKLRAALVPFDVPIFNEEGHSNEEKQSRKIREGPHEDADDTGEK